MLNMKKRREKSAMNDLDKDIAEMIREARRAYMKAYRDLTRKRRFSPRPQTRKKKKGRKK